MADVNIPDLAAATALTGAEQIEVVQAGVNKKSTVKAVASLQILSTVDANPNTALIVPGNLAGGAIFYQDPSITLYNEWKWSITNQIWVQTTAP